MAEPGAVQQVAGALPCTPARRQRESESVFEAVARTVEPTLPNQHRQDAVPGGANLLLRPPRPGVRARVRTHLVIKTSPQGALRHLPSREPTTPRRPAWRSEAVTPHQAGGPDRADLSPGVLAREPRAHPSRHRRWVRAASFPGRRSGGPPDRPTMPWGGPFEVAAPVVQPGGWEVPPGHLPG